MNIQYGWGNQSILFDRRVFEFFTVLAQVRFTKPQSALRHDVQTYINCIRLKLFRKNIARSLINPFGKSFYMIDKHECRRCLLKTRFADIKICHLLCDIHANAIINWELFISYYCRLKCEEEQINFVRKTTRVHGEKYRKQIFPG